MVTHEEFLKQIREATDSLGLLKLTIPNYLARGFRPDLLVMCGVDEGDRVYIDAINTKASLDRDVGALLKLKANLDENCISYRQVLGVFSDGIEQKYLDEFIALIGQNPKFLLIHHSMVKSILKKLMLTSMLEKLEKLNQEKLERYFEEACPRCGDLYEQEEFLKQNGNV